MIEFGRTAHLLRAVPQDKAFDVIPAGTAVQVGKTFSEQTPGSDALYWVQTVDGRKGLAYENEIG